MALRIVEKAAITDVGRQRQSNEDAFFERAPLFAVADGMGGARAGEVASRMAVEELDAMGDPGSKAEESLRNVARSANRRIYEMAQERHRARRHGHDLHRGARERPRAGGRPRGRQPRSTACATARSSG